MSVGVVIATYGHKDEWEPLVRRAADSVDRQTVAPAGRAWVHGADLASARNDGARLVGTDWLIMLDADDELDEHYIEAMLASEPGEIRRPSTIGVYEDGSTDDAPVMIPRTDMRRRNCCVIGSMVPADLFWEVGGFDGSLEALEDWDLWRRCLAAGATIIDVPDAIYRVHVRPDSRNSSDGAHGAAYRAILRSSPLAGDGGC